jgi:hypothetical protein
MTETDTFFLLKLNLFFFCTALLTYQVGSLQLFHGSSHWTDHV